MQDYDIACRDCKECIGCIAQASGLHPTIIIGEQPELQVLRTIEKFLIKHRGHNLVFDFDFNISVGDIVYTEFKDNKPLE